MRNVLYPKLAATNMKNHAQTYVPYMLTCIGTVLLFYIMFALSQNKTLGHDSLNFILTFGSFVIAFFAVIFLFYTHSFLIKRRKKEFGLFNILGMEKKHISKILLWETIYTAIISLIIGLLGGILFSKLLHLLLLKIMHFDVQMDIGISVEAIMASLLLFGIIFILILLNTLRQIHLFKPIELLQGGQVGEKEPKTKWILAVIGAICLGAGYFISVTTESPLDTLALFFIAVILVMVGTYCLFTAGSIALLKLLRKNKKFYYKTKHFTSVSGMMYRMKQNAVGLANICILSSAVLVMLSTTISLYVGMEDVLRTRFPRNIVVNSSAASDEQVQQLDGIIEAQTNRFNVTIKNPVRYRSMEFVTIQNGSSFNRYISGNFDSSSTILMCMPLEEYNQLENQSIKLASDEILLYTILGNIDGDTIQLGDTPFTIKDRLDAVTLADGTLPAMTINSYYIVVPDTQALETISTALGQNGEESNEMSYYYGFDTDTDSETQIALTKALKESIDTAGLTDTYTGGAEESRESFYSLYGGLLFLGIFLGVLFIMATVLIIYYKQITEGYEDKERFKIMQKVGMSHSEVKKSIHSQVLTVFFLPLIAAGIHIAFAFRAITRLLSLLNLNNVPLFAWCLVSTILIFGVFYAIVYTMTAKVYYKIVS